MKKTIDQPPNCLQVGPAPHLHQSRSTTAMMMLTSLCLLPAWGWGIWLYGWRDAGWPVVLAAGTAVLVELLINFWQRRWTVADGSALLSGLLLGLTLPPAVPFYIPVIAALFAMAVVKWSFGGLGQNWMNPALAGRALVFFSFPVPMVDHWLPPQSLVLPDAFSSATPLLVARSGFGQDLPQAPLSLLDGLDYTDLLFGFNNGSIGEAATLILLAGGLVLLAVRVISWHIPLGYLAAVAVGAWVIGGRPYSQPWFSGDPLFHLASGGVMLGAFFMATDPVTSPLHRRGMLIYAVLAGLLTVLFRSYGSYPEGAMFALLLANCCTPLIDHLVGDRIYGHPPGGFWRRKSERGQT